MSFIHRAVPATNPAMPPLLLLHGTGGDENDLVPLGQGLARGGALLSVRGQVKENGANRYFRRFAEGVLDHDDVRARADDLAAFVGTSTAELGLRRPIAIGYSNGANIAAAILHRHPGTLAGAVLMRPMVPLPENPAVRLDNLPILILAGAHDAIAPLIGAQALAERFSTAGASAKLVAIEAGHPIVSADMARALSWLDVTFERTARPTPVA